MDDKEQAEADLLAQAEKIIEEELAKVDGDGTTIGAVIRAFSCTRRQAIIAIQSAQENIAAMMSRAGLVSPGDYVTTTVIGAWAEMYLTYNQRLSLIAFHVGKTVALDWEYRRDPETGRVRPQDPNAEYQI